MSKKSKKNARKVKKGVRSHRVAKKAKKTARRIKTRVVRPRVRPKAKAAKAKAAKAKAAKAKRPVKARTPKSLPPAKEKAASGSGAPQAAPLEPAKRKLGIRGAAPWAARHAAKHAAEARARAAVPPPPGSARATIRTPTGAEEIKAKIADLQTALNEVRNLRRNFALNFYDIGLVLRSIRLRKLYEARGFGTFEGFVEREVDLGKTTSLRLVRLVDVFKKEAALEYGADRVIYAFSILEAPDKPIPMVPPPASAAANRTALPLRPPVPAKR